MLPTHLLETSPGFGDNNMLTFAMVSTATDWYSSLRKKVTVDAGTGYYIEMSVERAHKFCSRTATAGWCFAAWCCLMTWGKWQRWNMINMGSNGKHHSYHSLDMTCMIRMLATCWLCIADGSMMAIENDQWPPVRQITGLVQSLVKLHVDIDEDPRNWGHPIFSRPTISVGRLL